MIIRLALAPSSTTSAPRLDPLLDLSDCRFNIFLSETFLFFHVEDNGILAEFAHSFSRLIFNTAQLRFYHCTL